jgi:uncharacterized membrane protein
MEFLYFFGRFHVVFLHIPIGIIIAVFFLELLARRERYRHLESAAPFLWIAAAVSAIVTVALGYMHFAEGGFSGASGNQHRTFGTALAIILTVVALLRASRFASNYAPAFLPAAILMVLLASITGHYGGNLTHGPTYLVEYGPGPLRALAGLGARTSVASLEAADPFADLVGPMLNTHCSGCHNPDQRQAELDLTSHAGVMDGGETGSVISRGRPDQSELFNRITLSQRDEAFMPAEGRTPLSYAQVRIIEWWIAAGAPADTTFGVLDTALGEELDEIVRAELGLSD